MKSAAATQPFALGVVILAAGASKRMGKSKLLLPWSGTSILGHVLSEWQALGAGQVAVVYADGDRNLEAELDRLGFPVTGRICNPAPERGMFTSIQCAAAWPGRQAALTHWAIVLGDQPHLRRQMLRQVLDFSAAHPTQVCQPARRGHGRHPVLLPKEIFQQLAGTKATALKEFIGSLAGRIALLEIDDPGLDLDIDRPGDYERALKTTVELAGPRRE